MIYGFQIEVQRSSVKNTDSLLLGAISKMRTTANGTKLAHEFERRTAGFAVYLPVNAIDKNLISSKK